MVPTDVSGASLVTWSPSWAVEPDPQGLVLSAGADRRLALDGCSAATVATVQRWAAGDEITAPDDDDRRVLARLAELGAVVPIAASTRAVALRGAPPLVDDLMRELVGHGYAAGDGPIVVVRDGSSGAPGPPEAPAPLHLGLDVRAHHHVVIGPLVVPGVTTCLTCLDQRAVRRWPAPIVPARPAVTRWTAVIAALLAVQLELIAERRSPLVNATIAWDLERGTTDRQSVYRLIGCPTCDTAAAPGRVSLPWAP